MCEPNAQWNRGGNDINPNLIEFKSLQSTYQMREREREWERDRGHTYIPDGWMMFGIEVCWTIPPSLYTCYVGVSWDPLITQ